MFKFVIDHQDTRTVVTLNGDMDIDVTEIVQDEMAPLLWDSKQIELDFDNVPFVDSSGIGLLISLLTDLRERGKKVVITHLKPDVKEVFSLLQLPEIVGHDVFSDFEAGGI